MKRNLTLAALAAFLLVVPTACKSVDAGQDALVVRAEQTASVAMEVIDSFLKWELNNRAILADNVKQSANNVRKEAPLAIDTLRSVTKAYKANRTEENKATLVTWLAVVDRLQGVAASYLGATR